MLLKVSLGILLIFMWCDMEEEYFCIRSDSFEQAFSRLKYTDNYKIIKHVYCVIVQTSVIIGVFYLSSYEFQYFILPF